MNNHMTQEEYDKDPTQGIDEPSEMSEHIAGVAESMAHASREMQLKRAAEVRAQLTAIVNQMGPAVGSLITEHLRELRGEVNNKTFRDSIRYHLDNMSANGLLQRHKPEDGGPYVYGAPGSINIPVARKDAKLTKAQQDRAAHARKALAESRARTRELMKQAEAVVVKTEEHKTAVATGSQEVELVIAGVTIVVSKNPVTGRPRVVIE